MASAVTQPQSYIPPKWLDITPLLYYSARLWALFFLFALFREFLDRILRPSVPRRPGSTMRQRLVQALSAYYKRARLAVNRWQIPESDLIVNVRLPRCIFGAFICAFYIINTHTKNVTPFFYFIQVLYGVVAFLCLVFDFIYTPNPVYFMFRPGIVVECLTIPSLLLASNSLWLNFNFLQAYSILTLWYNLAQHEIVLKNATQLSRLYTSMSLELATFVYVTACGVHFFELLGDPGQTIRNNTFYITWANSLYFAVVTLMTVGYGDFAPYTFFGRVWIVVHIIRAAYLVVREMDFLYTTEANQRHGITSYVETLEYNHIVLTGYIKWEFLKNFVVEFLKDGTNENTKVVVLTSCRTWGIDEWDKFISRNVFYDYRVFHVEGSPLDHFDLERARIVSARAVFVFSDPHRGDPYDEDSGCLKTILSIRKYGGNVPIFTFNISQNSSAQFAIAMEQIDTDWIDDSFTAFAPENNRDGMTDGGGILDGIIPDTANVNINRSDDLDANNSANIRTFNSNEAIENTPLILRGSPEHQLDFNDSRLWYDESMDRSPAKKRSGESLCTQEFEMALLAENVFCNGLSTLLANLVLHFAPIPKPKDRLWLLEYKLGAQCSIVPLVMPEIFYGKSYESVATVLMDYGIVLLAVQENSDESNKEKWRIITCDTIFKKDQQCMVITYHAVQSVQWILERLLDNFEKAMENQHAHEMESRYEYNGRADDSNEASIPSPSRTPHSFNASGSGAQRHQLFSLEKKTSDRSDRTRSHSQLPTTTSRADNPFSASSSTSNIRQAGNMGSGLPGPVSNRNRPEYRYPFIDNFEDEVDGEEPGYVVGRRRYDSFDGLEDAVVPDDVSIAPHILRGSLPMVFEGHSDALVRDYEDDRRTQSSTSRSASSSRETAPRPTASSGPSSNNNSGYATSNERRRMIRNSVQFQQGGHVNWEKSSMGTPSSSTPTARIYTHLHTIPAKLHNHVIICLDGEHSLKSLKVLLENIWKKRKSQSRRAKVVVIHPNFPKNFEREMANAGTNKGDLFLLRGHSLSTATLETAQYWRSRGLLILNRENCGTDSTRNTDSKAIFTVMTLDSMPYRAHVFVCCMLDAEESLRLMRAPRHPRSIAFDRDDDNVLWDSDFGDDIIANDGAHEADNDDNNKGHRNHSAYRNGNTRSRNRNRNNTSANDKPPSTPIPRSISGTFHAGFDNTMNTAESFSRNNSFQSRGSNLAGMLVDDDWNDSNYYDEFQDTNSTSQENGTHFKYKAEGELCERQRYASGEMIISTLYAALLVREESQPGFIEVIRLLLGITNCNGNGRSDSSGAGAGSGSWVRLVKVPEKWTQSALPECRNYRETSQMLFKLGVVTVGLYRSGRAAVRYMTNEKEGTFERRQEGVSYNEASASNNENGMSLATLLPTSFTNPIPNETSALLGHRARSRSRSPARSRTGTFDESDSKLTYTCPSTGRVIEYTEHKCDNVLPYVYCFPEPYTVVDPGDGVFVVCHPDKDLPADWNLPDIDVDSDLGLGMDMDIDLDIDMDIGIHGDFTGSGSNRGGYY